MLDLHKPELTHRCFAGVAAPLPEKGVSIGSWACRGQEPLGGPLIPRALPVFVLGRFIN